MFLYLRNVTTKEDFEFAKEVKADLIGMELDYENNLLTTEKMQGYAHQIPFGMWRAGIFKNAPYRELEEFVTFFHLDVMEFTTENQDLSRFENVRKITNFPCDEADCIISSEEIETDKPFLLSGEHGLMEWIDILENSQCFGVALDVKKATKEVCWGIKSL